MELSWDSSHKVAFDAIKEKLTRTPVLSFFNPKADHVIQTDASMKGLGAVLLQQGRRVVYVSRTLIPAETLFQHRKRVTRSSIRYGEAA